MKTWAPLWNGIVDSSIWDEPDYVVKIFLTMLAVKDSDHIVRLNAYQIGKKARKDEREVLDALKVLSSPDTKRIEKQEFDGRRIMAVEEGWLILNGQKYRDAVSLEMKRARNRKAQAAWREKQKLMSNREDLIRQHQANARLHQNHAEELNRETDSMATSLIESSQSEQA